MSKIMQEGSKAPKFYKIWNISVAGLDARHLKLRYLSSLFTNKLFSNTTCFFKQFANFFLTNIRIKTKRQNKQLFLSDAASFFDLSKTLVTSTSREQLDAAKQKLRQFFVSFLMQCAIPEPNRNSTIL